MHNHFSSEERFSIRVEWKGKLFSDRNPMMVVAGYVVLKNEIKLEVKYPCDISEGIQSLL